MRHRILDTFTGPFALIQHDDSSLATTWVTSEMTHCGWLAASRLDPRLLPDLARRLKAYFAGDADVDFDDVPTPNATCGDGDGFWAQCWDACRRISRGQTRSYTQLALAAGASASACRAAGQAMRHNPLPIIVPCHRVVSASGKLHGFAGSCDADGPQLAIKRALLSMEGVDEDGGLFSVAIANQGGRRVAV
jgi:methylated-DNA-[protein]-cysteine S-methyltransferase